MVKPISDYTIDELSAKIEAIKAEHERTANALKKYEEEFKRRKQEVEVPLGVPLKGTLNEMPYEAVSKSFIKWFSCEASADKFEEYFVNFVKALQDIAEGKPIDIKVLFPLLPKGWVAMNRYKNEWIYHEKKPTCYSGAGLEYWESDGWKIGFLPFNLKPADDWRNSLMECGL